MQMQLSLAPLTDLAALRSALSEAGLPDSDIDEPGRHFWSCRTEAGEIIGFAGLETYGGDALLRSVIVSAGHRGRGYGRRLFELMAEAAHAQGARRFWLLTVDAAPFFIHLGFIKADRNLAPPAIAASREFTALCPASAVCLMKML